MNRCARYSMAFCLGLGYVQLRRFSQGRSEVMSELRQCSRRLAAECGFIAIGGLCVALSSCGGTDQREIEHGTAGGGVSATNSQNRGGWLNATTRATTGGMVGSGPSSASSNPPTGSIGPGGSGSGGDGLGGDSSPIATGQTEASGGT